MMMFWAWFFGGVAATFFIEFIAVVTIAINRKKGGSK
jgi:hypothetical protein